MKVLSLFDGISCARVALERAGIPVEVYYASEIDKYAIQISQKNYPDIINLGDVTELSAQHSEKYDHSKTRKNHLIAFIGNEIDLLIGGSPCQDLSIANKDRKGLDGERSGLFWEYFRILKEVKPKYFILENVASMPKEAKDIITETLGVEPIMINASLVSAQNRKRLFWTNIPNVTLPEDRGILLKDILEKNVDNSFYMSDKLIESVTRSNYRDRKPMKIIGKCNTLKLGGDVKRIIQDDGRWRYLTPTEYCRLQGLPDNYTDAGVAKSRQYFGVGNAFNVDVVAHILSFIANKQ